MQRVVVVLSLLLLLAASSCLLLFAGDEPCSIDADCKGASCGADGICTHEAAGDDAGALAGRDAGPPDSGAVDSGPKDGGTGDGGAGDGGRTDSGFVGDSGTPVDI